MGLGRPSGAGGVFKCGYPAVVSTSTAFFIDFVRDLQAEPIAAFDVTTIGPDLTAGVEYEFILTYTNATGNMHVGVVNLGPSDRAIAGAEDSATGTLLITAGNTSPAYRGNGGGVNPAGPGPSSIRIQVRVAPT